MTSPLRDFLFALPVKLREEDKIQHMVWSFWLTLAACLLLPGLMAISGVLLLGFAKESWDFRYGSGFCLFDMVGNLIGIGLGTLAVIGVSVFWSFVT